MALSIWMLSLAQTSKTIRWRTDLSSDLSSISIRLKLKREPPQNRQELLRQAVDSEWRCAREIAVIAGVTYKSAVRYLLTIDDSIDRKLEEWTDARLRNRKRWVYRKKSMSSKEQAELLNSVLFFNRIKPVIEPPKITYVNP